MNDHSRRWLSYRRPSVLLLSGLLFALLLNTPLINNAYGQEPETEQKPAAEQNGQAEQPANSTAPLKTQDEKSTGKQSTEVFRPSEEISEDLSVPFPVDI